MKEKNKHDHRATKCLKTIIFSILMLAPFLAIGSKLAYVTFNKNAYESYRGQYSFISNTNFLDTTTNTLSGTVYTITGAKLQNKISYLPIDSTNVTNQSKIFFYNISELKINADYDLSNYNAVYIGRTEMNTNTTATLSFFNLPNGTITRFDPWRVYIDGVEYNSQLNINYYNKRYELSFYNDSVYMYAYKYADRSYNYQQWNNDLLIESYIVDKTLSSVFYSAVDELDDASIFSWTTNTMIYSSVTGMTEGLGIVSPPLAVLITYWTILTSIYIIIDIVLEMFIFLTHWASDKL